MTDNIKNLIVSNFSIQAFANTNTTETSGLSDEMKTFYCDTLIDNATPNLVHDQFGDKYPIPKNSGKKIEFRKWSALPKALTPLTEGVTPAGQSLSVTAIDATVAQYGAYTEISDVLELTAIDNTLLQATQILGDQAGVTIDSVVREVISAGTNVLYAPKIADGAETAVTSRADLDATAKISLGVLLKAASILKRQNTKTFSDGSYVAIIHPDTWLDIMKDPDFKDWNKGSAPEKMWEGEVGKIGNIRFVESTEAKIWTGSGCPSGLAVYSTLVIGQHAYATTELSGGGLEHIVKPLGSGGSSDPLNQRQTAGWKATKVAKILSNEFMLRVEHCTSNSASAEAN